LLKVPHLWPTDRLFHRGELLRLKLGDLDRNQGLLSIVETKFHKSRLVPLDPTVTGRLEHYLQERGRRKLPMTSDAFLLWSGNHSPEVYAAYSLLSLWRRLCVSVKVLDAQGHPPRLHDLRHYPEFRTITGKPPVAAPNPLLTGLEQHRFASQLGIVLSPIKGS
jgi:integrase